MQEFLYGFSGFRPQVDAVRLDPSLPPQLAGITLSNLDWQGRTFTLHIGPQETSVTLEFRRGDAANYSRRSEDCGGSALHLSFPPDALILQPTEDLVRCRQIYGYIFASGIAGGRRRRRKSGDSLDCRRTAGETHRRSGSSGDIGNDQGASWKPRSFPLLGGSVLLTASSGRQLPLRLQITPRESMSSLLRRFRRSLCDSSFLALATRRPAASLS